MAPNPLDCRVALLLVMTRWCCAPRNNGITCAKTQTAALDGADALVIVTEWREFCSPGFGILKAKLKNPVIFDGRNFYAPKLLRRLGIQYLSIGR